MKGGGGVPVRIIMIRFVARTYPPCWVLKAQIQKHRGKPLLFHDKCLGFFYVQHTGPTSLRSIRMTKQLWLSVLLKDTSAATGQAGIRTHILTASELESNALYRSATTLTEVMKPYTALQPGITPKLRCNPGRGSKGMHYKEIQLFSINIMYV